MHMGGRQSRNRGFCVNHVSHVSGRRMIEACPPLHVKKVDMLLDSDDTLLETLPTSSDDHCGSSDGGQSPSVGTHASSDGTSGISLMPSARWSPHMGHMGHANHDYYPGSQSL
jgi:hypothetical protein